MIISKDDDLYIIKIIKDKIKGVDIYDTNFISTFFRDMLYKLKNRYNIKGFCDIEVFVNKEYGMIVEVDNLYKYGNDIDVKIKFHIGSLFMNEISCYDLIYHNDCYLYKDRYYTIYKDITDSEVLYKDTYNIIKNGIKIK